MSPPSPVLAAFASLPLLLLAACSVEARPAVTDGGATPIPDAAPIDWIDGAPGLACDKIDFLFIIDDSGSMTQEQANLAANFPAFAAAIDAYRNDDDVPIDYRIAITTTGRDVFYTVIYPDTELPVPSMGDDGEFRQSCGMTRKWIERTDPDVTGTFSCAAQVGKNGSGMEMPLYASKLAFTARLDDGLNAGFLRADALLAVVILTDEDDCSREDNDFDVVMQADNTLECTARPVAEYVAFLDELKVDRSRWAVSVIAGETDCTSDFGGAVEAVRLKELVTQVGANASFGSICDGDLTASLATAMDTFVTACEEFGSID